MRKGGVFQTPAAPPYSIVLEVTSRVVAYGKGEYGGVAGVCKKNSM